MSELINTVLINNPFYSETQDRKEFYKEQIKEFEEKGRPSKAVEVVNIFLINKHGELILQKRASTKNHNPNLIDKSIGGHIVHGDTPNYTAMIETVQELQVPSIVLNNENDFKKTYELLKGYTGTTAIIKYFGTELVQLEKIINSEKVIIGNKTFLFIGVYDGPVKNVDKEAKGVLFYTLEELEIELQKYPDTFTEDLKYYCSKYKNVLKEFITEIKKDM